VIVKKYLSLIVITLISAIAYAQEIKLHKDLKCFDQTGFTTLDMLVSSRESGGYVAVAEWSEQVSSSKIVHKTYHLEGGIQYALIVATEQQVDATGIEVRDSRGTKLEYVNTINDLSKNQITFFYTPPYDDNYELSFRVVNSNKPLTCLYMAIMKGDPDPDAQ
jgi:hypothetical protein